MQLDIIILIRLCGGDFAEKKIQEQLDNKIL